MLNSFVNLLKCAAGLLALLAVSAQAAHPNAKDYLSPDKLLPDRAGQFIYIAQVTAQQIAVFDVATQKVTRTIPLPNPPAGMVFSKDEQRLYVAGAVPEGKVHIVEVASGKIVDALAVGHTPTALVLSPDGGTLYVGNRYNGNISFIELASKKEVARVAASREPVSAAISPDGKFLFVANQLPAGASNLDYVAAEVSVIDVARRAPAKPIKLPNGSTGLREIALSPDGQYAYVTHTLGRYHLPATQLDRGWVQTSAVTVIDVAKRESVNTFLLDDVDLGAANPWGIAVTADGRHLCVTHAGTHEISVIDRVKLHDKLAQAAAGKPAPGGTSVIEVPNDLAFLVGLRQRVKLSGNGPRGLAIVGGKAYAAEYFTGSLAVVEIGSQTSAPAPSVSLGTEQPMTAARRGEMLFHDAQYCFQKWLSCSSCHPTDGRTDGLNWDLLLDGLGNPKRVRNLLFAHQTAPTTSTATRPNAEASVRAGYRFIQFAVRPEADYEAVDEYLKSLRPVPSPHLVKGQLSPAAKRGEQLFKQANCTDCHAGSLYTKARQHDVGTGLGREKGLAFDTPMLVEAWRNGPYLHDGRAATIEEVLTKYNPTGGHGDTSGLTPEQIRELAEFVRSL